MDERRSVVDDVQESGLLDLSDSPDSPRFLYLYKRMFKEMAELADASGGREFTRTPEQLANRLGIDSTLEKETRERVVENLCKEMIRIGIVAEESENQYRWANLPRLKEVVRQIEAKEERLYPFNIPLRKR